ncbi:MAG: FAD-binding oxidoreductase [Burkholderiaceae bacterium]|nr:MAG: FAD-binding oxidoreductase [Burkholderiaceae bacterium]
MSNKFLSDLASLIGAHHVLTAPQDVAPYLTDWRQRYTGQALAVVAPATTEEVAAIVKRCAAERIGIVPQGGNTGLCGGATPDTSGTQIVLSLRRLQRIRAVDPLNNTLTVEAGVTLLQAQEAAHAAERLFPLSLASEGSCTIGGNLATNAGGTAVLRYGNARELTLGLEVVTAQGEIWQGLTGLRKDNTGYDLRDLFIGAEGTLGIITAATLKLYPLPKATATALVSVNTLAHALQLLTLAQSHAAAALTTFEAMSDLCLRLVNKHTQRPLPFAQGAPYAVLLELSDLESEEHAQSVLNTLLAAALEKGIAQDAIIASSLQQAQQLWALRERIPEAEALEGRNIKHDISLPLSRLAEFCERCEQALHALGTPLQLVVFGHLGDGNLHYNIALPKKTDVPAFALWQEKINRVVYKTVAECSGSISAEHGIGQLKRDTLPHYKDATALRLMRSIKQALDPLGIMNPGKVL